MKDIAELKLLMEWQEQRWGADHPKVVASLESIADLLHMRGKYGEAEPYYWQILEKKHKQFGANDLRVADTIYDLACLHEQQENWEECERLYKWTCDIRCKLLPQGAAQLDDSVSKVKEIASKQGHDLDVEEFIAAETGPAGGGLKFDWEAYMERCRTLTMERDYELAETILHCLQDVAKSYEPSSRVLAECMHLLGKVQLLQRHLEDSLHSFERALALYEKIAGTSSLETASCLEDMADLHCKMGEAAQAEFLFNWALQIHESLLTDKQSPARIRTKLESLPELCQPQAKDAEQEGEPALEPEAAAESETAAESKPAAADDAERAGKKVGRKKKDKNRKERIEESLQDEAENFAVETQPVAESRIDEAAARNQDFTADGGAEEGESGTGQDQVAHFLWTKWIKTGKAALEKGDLLEAENMLNCALEKANEFGIQDSRLWQTLCEIADLYTRQSKFVKAVSSLSTAQQYCEKTLGPSDPENAVYWKKLGSAYESQGDKIQAMICFDKLVTILVKANRPLVEYGLYLKKLERLHEQNPANFAD